jgi:hypothetical protein
MNLKNIVLSKRKYIPEDLILYDYIHMKYPEKVNP